MPQQIVGKEESLQRKVTIVLPQFSGCDALNDSHDYYPLVDKLKHYASQQAAPIVYRYFSGQYAYQLPIASITGFADGLDTSTGFWLRADPVDFQIDINSAYFYGSRHLDLNMSQVRSLADEIRPIIESYGYELYAPKPYRWYLKLPAPVAIKTPAPETMMGANVRDYLMEVDVSWRKMFTEVQMALKQNAVNLHLKREVTGLWFWGGGYLPELPMLPWTKIYGDGPIAEGFAKLKQLPYVEDSYKIFSDSKESGNDLIMVNDLRAMQVQVLSPLYHALRKRQLQQIELYLGEENLYVIEAKKVPVWWLFWQK